ncbi:MAG: CapA family protein [Bacteroidaceae bacterium]|nr:CapA family protein [Bacteroidaceae bacterium]
MKRKIRTICLALMAMSAQACSGSTRPNTFVDLTTDSVQVETDADTIAQPVAETLTIALCGDIMMGTTYPNIELPPNDGRDIFRDTKPYTQLADLALGNLEGALSDGGKCTKSGGPNSYAFRMPTAYGQLLLDAGYDYLSMANNHVNDFGPTAIEDGERTLTELGIAFSGVRGRQEYAVVERNGVRYGICAFGHNEYTLRHTDLDNVKRVLDAIKAQGVDIIIVSFHGGAEGRSQSHLPQGTEYFLGENRGSLREMAHFCIDNGASLVFGHGPHVVRCMEVYNGHFIAYSLGNFCTPYGMSLTGISAYSPVVSVEINRNGQFLHGQIHSFIQTKGVGPRADSQLSVAKEIKQLTEADITGSPIRISETGEITLAAE